MLRFIIGRSNKSIDLTVMLEVVKKKIFKDMNIEFTIFCFLGINCNSN